MEENKESAIFRFCHHLNLKAIRWTCLGLFILLFVYTAGYGLLYKLVDNSQSFRRFGLILAYPINYLRVYSRIAYDFTEYSYQLFGGTRPIHERCRDLGYHRECCEGIIAPKNYYYIYHNGKKIGESYFYDDGKPYIITRLMHKYDVFYPSGQCALSMRDGVGKAFWSDGTMFASWTFDKKQTLEGAEPMLVFKNMDLDLILHPIVISFDEKGEPYIENEPSGASSTNETSLHDDDMQSMHPEKLKPEPQAVSTIEMDSPVLDNKQDNESSDPFAPTPQGASANRQETPLFQIDSDGNVSLVLDGKQDNESSDPFAPTPQGASVNRQETPLFQIDDSVFNRNVMDQYRLVVIENENGKRVKVITDLSSFGGTASRIAEYMELFILHGGVIIPYYYDYLDFK